MSLKNEKINVWEKNAKFITALLSLILLTLFYSEEIKGYTLEGLRLCASSIIPNLFPFMIYPELLIALSDCSATKVLEAVFEKISGMRKESLLPFVCGTLCGFPSGALLVVGLCESGLVERDDATYIVCLSTTPSIAFCIGGVGGALGNDTLGFLLWCSTVSSAFLCALFFKKKNTKIVNPELKPRQKFDFISSIKRCGTNLIYISSYITFFSVIVGLVKKVTKSSCFSLLISLFLEVGGASYKIAASEFLCIKAKIILLAFALAFSGICVFMQIISIMPKGTINKKEYLITMLLHGIISSCITAFFTLFVDFR